MDILRIVEDLAAQWQQALGSEVEVVLGGSLVSGLFILNEETEVIDGDFRFLTDNPTDENLRARIEALTGLKYRKTITVGDWPQGESQGVMVEGILEIPGLPLPLEVEGCIRNRAYVGWHRFYQDVLTEEELAAIRQKKIELRGDKKAYKAYKSSIREEVVRRVIARGLLN